MRYNINEMEEQWKAIPEFPGYEVSDKGRVRSFKRRAGPPGEWYISDTPARILSPSYCPKGGYAGVLLCKNGKAFRRRIAALVLLAFVGPRPEGLEICHYDSNPVNDALTNLRYDTRQSNLEDYKRVTNERVKKMRRWRAVGASYMELANAFELSYATVRAICTGQTHKDKEGPITRKKLNDDQVRAVRKMRKEGATYRKIGEAFGFSESHACLICQRKRYAHVEDAAQPPRPAPQAQEAQEDSDEVL